MPPENGGLYCSHKLGTFARVWLVRLKDAQSGDENKVFALKILRKVDGMLRPVRLLLNHHSQPPQ